MPPIARLTAVAVAVAAATLYLLGIFDCPGFARQDALLPDADGSHHRELYALVATTTDKNVGGNIGRLLEGTKKGIDSLPDGADLLRNAAKKYDSSAETIAVSLFLDHPKQVDAPRWATGWAVYADSFHKIQHAVTAVQDKSGLTDETIRAVRLGKGPVLRGSIPWRTMLTPIIGAMLNWKRALKIFDQEGYEAPHCGDHRKDETCCHVALELYLSGEKDRMLRVDYALLLGDNTHVMDDSFPLNEYTKEDVAMVE